MEGIAEHLMGDGAVGGDKGQHGAHVGVDHAGALGDGAQADLLTPDGQGDGDLLLHRVGGHDGVGGGIGAVGRQGGGGLGQPGLDGGDVDGLADDAGTGHGLPAGGGGGGSAHGLGVLMALGAAGVGVAAVGHHAPGHAAFQVVHGHIQGGGLHPVHGIGGGGGALLLRQDQGQVVLVRAAARLHAAVDAGGGKSLGGTHAAGNLIQHSDLPRFP